MDCSPDLSFVGGTSDFRRLQELTPIKIPFLENAFNSGNRVQMGKVRDPGRKVLKTSQSNVKMTTASTHRELPRAEIP